MIRPNRISWVAFFILFFFLANFSYARASDPMAEKTVFFPECHVRLTIPADWYGFNETDGEIGVVYVTKQKLTGPKSQFKVGLQLMTHFEKKTGRPYASTEELANRILGINGKYSITVDDPLSFETGIGTFLSSKMSRPMNKDLFLGNAVLKNETGEFIFMFEAPSDEWEAAYPVFMRIMKSIQLTSAPREGDQVVYDYFEHPWTAVYKQRDVHLKKDLEQKLSRLTIGMSESKYKKIMGVKKERVYYEKINTYGIFTLTPGWVNTVQISADQRSYVDIYGVYDRCVALEMFAVTIDGYRISNIEVLNRTAPPEFPVDEWDRRLSGRPWSDEFISDVDDDLMAWASQKDRVIKAFELAQKIPIGTTEQEYLVKAGGFAISYPPFMTRYVPGVYFTTNAEADENGDIAVIYFYGYPVKDKVQSVGRVIVSNGIISRIEANDMLLTPDK